MFIVEKKKPRKKSLKKQIKVPCFLPINSIADLMKKICSSIIQHIFFQFFMSHLSAEQRGEILNPLRYYLIYMVVKVMITGKPIKIKLSMEKKK